MSIKKNTATLYQNCHKLNILFSKYQITTLNKKK